MSPVGTLEKTEQHKYRCGHCRKYHTSRDEIRACSTTVTDWGSKARTVKKVPAKAKKIKKVLEATDKVMAKESTAIPSSPNIDQVGKQNPSLVKTVDPVDVALDLVEKPGDDAEDFSWQIINGIASGAYDVNLDELDQAITDRLLALGYSFIDDTQPLRKKHSEALGKAKAATTDAESDDAEEDTSPGTAKAPQRPVKAPKPTVPTVTHLEGIPVEDFVVDRSEPMYHRLPKYARAKYRSGHRYYKVIGENRKSFTAYVLLPDEKNNGTVHGSGFKTTLLRKEIVEFLKQVTAETADFRKDIIRAEKVDVKSALAEVKSVTTVDTDDDDDDGPVPVAQPKVKVEKVARIATGASKAAKRRRLMRA